MMATLVRQAEERDGVVKELIRDALGTFRSNPLGGLELMGRAERLVQEGGSVTFKVLVGHRFLRVRGMKWGHQVPFVTWAAYAVGPDGEDIDLPRAFVGVGKASDLNVAELFAILVRLDRGE
jgi:hypothetical protein